MFLGKSMTSMTRLAILNHQISRMATRRSLHSRFNTHKLSVGLVWIPFRTLKTTNKKDEVHVEVYDREYIEKQSEKPRGPQTAEEFADVNSQKHWISFGYDYVDQKEDKHLANAYFFSYFTLGLIVFSYIVYYYPYLDGTEWAQREAFLELDRRERLGLPLVDPNLVPPETVKLPSDEELGDFKVHL